MGFFILITHKSKWSENPTDGDVAMVHIIPRLYLLLTSPQWADCGPGPHDSSLYILTESDFKVEDWDATENQTDDVRDEKDS